MTEYFLGLIAFAFVGAIIFSLAPDGKSKKYVRLLCGLCSIGCIAFPIFELINSGGEEVEGIASLFEASGKIEENSVEIYNNYLNYATVENAEKNLKDEVISRTSANTEDIDVKILISENSGEYYIDDVVVYLYRSGYDLDPKIIDEICQNRLSKGCTIIYK